MTHIQTAKFFAVNMAKHFILSNNFDVRQNCCKTNIAALTVLAGNHATDDISRYKWPINELQLKLLLHKNKSVKFCN